jgi:hypothetical protein
MLLRETFSVARCPYQSYVQVGANMSLTPEDLAFLKKIGQVSESAPKPVSNKKEEE